MSNKPHRESADDARKAAAKAELTNVRDRELRSAAAHDALAQQGENIAAKLKERVEEAKLKAITEAKVGKE